MLKNILKITLRNLSRNSLYAVINILGLAVGLAVFLSILTLVRHEYSFNKDIPDEDRIYRIYTRFTGSFSGTNKGLSNGIPSFIMENFTGIEAHAHIHTWTAEVSIPLPDGSEKSFEDQSHLVITNPGLFEVIDIWDWEAGSIESLERPHTVALLRSQAEKYFGSLPSSEYLGREVTYRDSLRMQVAGVLRDPEITTDFTFTDFLSSATIEASFLKENYDLTNWESTSSSDNLLLKLESGVGKDQLASIISKTEEKQKEMSEDESWVVNYVPQPLSDIHYNTEIGVFDNNSHVANQKILKYVFLAGLIILLIAIINFINLETAIGGRRGREIGIRKILGSSKLKVMLQFMTHSILLTFVAVLLTVPLTILGLSFFSDFLPEGVAFEPGAPVNILILLLITIVVGLFAGFYPALVMSSFNPLNVLKSSTPVVKSGKGSGFLRKGLTIFQFAFSQVLLIVAFIAIYQIDFMVNKDLGFNPENVMYVSTPYHLSESKREAFRNELNGISGIQKVSRFNSLPIAQGWTSSIFNFIQEDGTESEHEVFIKHGDSSYVNFFEMEMIAGRKLRTEQEVLINEVYMNELGFDNPREAIDVMLDPKGDSLIVAGVIKDFHFQSLHNRIKPMLISLNKEGKQFGIKIHENTDSQDVQSQIEKAYSKVYPDNPINAQFYQSAIEGFYESEERTAKLIGAATGLALFISCLGLFGLSSFMSIQRTREIGIRKVQGATRQNILKLLTIDFLKLVGVAILVAFPVAYYIGQNWLEEFAYKAPFNVWLFLLSGFFAVLIAFLTVSYHSLMAAKINPVECLRSE